MEAHFALEGVYVGKGFRKNSLGMGYTARIGEE